MIRDSIYSQVRDLVRDRIASGVIVHADWITSEIVQKYSDIEGEDASFYQLCARNHIREIVRSVIEKSGEASRPGFDRLRDAYLVSRHGRSVLVPLDLLTDEELQARADELEKMAKGCRGHAAELMRIARVGL